MSSQKRTMSISSDTICLFVAICIFLWYSMLGSNGTQWFFILNLIVAVICSEDNSCLFIQLIPLIQFENPIFVQDFPATLCVFTLYNIQCKQNILFSLMEYDSQFRCILLPSGKNLVYHKWLKWRPWLSIGKDLPERCSGKGWHGPNFKIKFFCSGVIQFILAKFIGSLFSIVFSNSCWLLENTMSISVCSFWNDNPTIGSIITLFFFKSKLFLKLYY